jgi:hypothetical protein
VPAGKQDLGIGVTLANDPGVAYYGVLTAPDGQVYSYQTNQLVQPDGTIVNDRSLQIYRRNPQPGRWLFSLDFANPVSGLATSQKFHGTLAFDTVKVQAALPSGARLKAGVPVTVPVKVTNTGVAPLTYFADGRLDATGDIPLAELSGHNTDIPLPVPAGIFPQWLVPTNMNQLTFTASATQPVNLDVFYNSGEPELYSAAQGNGAVVRLNTRQVSPGAWFGDIGQHGPFAGPATPGTVSVAASAHGQLFDPAVTSSTGDIWQAGVDPGSNPALASALRKAGQGGPLGLRANTAAATAEPAPVTLAPGKSATISVTVTPGATKGSVVRGHLYVDTFNQFTLGGDELIDLPYAYTVG